MSNHSGSYMLNAVLHLLDQYNFFNVIGKERTLAFFESIRLIGCNEDCNNSEIIEDIGEKLNICYICWEYGDNLEYGACDKCRSSWLK